MNISEETLKAKSGWSSAGLGLVVAAISLLLLTETDSIGQARSRTRGGENPLVKSGEFAPDFELPRLTITTDSNGEPIGLISETGTVKLSSFRGKKPVCLIMSSYT